MSSRTEFLYDTLMAFQDNMGDWIERKLQEAKARQIARNEEMRAALEARENGDFSAMEVLGSPDFEEAYTVVTPEMLFGMTENPKFRELLEESTAAQFGAKTASDVANLGLAALDFADGPAPSGAMAAKFGKAAMPKDVAFRGIRGMANIPVPSPNELSFLKRALQSYDPFTHGVADESGRIAEAIQDRIIDEVKKEVAKEAPQAGAGVDAWRSIRKSKATTKSITASPLWKQPPRSFDNPTGTPVKLQPPSERPPGLSREFAKELQDAGISLRKGHGNWRGHDVTQQAGLAGDFGESADMSILDRLKREAEMLDEAITERVDEMVSKSDPLGMSYDELIERGYEFPESKLPSVKAATQNIVDQPRKPVYTMAADEKRKAVDPLYREPEAPVRATDPEQIIIKRQGLLSEGEPTEQLRNVTRRNESIGAGGDRMVLSSGEQPLPKRLPSTDVQKMSIPEMQEALRVREIQIQNLEKWDAGIERGKGYYNLGEPRVDRPYSKDNPYGYLTVKRPKGSSAAQTGKGVKGDKIMIKAKGMSHDKAAALRKEMAKTGTKYDTAKSAMGPYKKGDPLFPHKTQPEQGLIEVTGKSGKPKLVPMSAQDPGNMVGYPAKKGQKPKASHISTEWGGEWQEDWIPVIKSDRRMFHEPPKNLTPEQLELYKSKLRESAEKELNSLHEAMQSAPEALKPAFEEAMQKTLKEVEWIFE